MDDLTWTCHVCKKERPDARISVMKTEVPMEGMPGGTIMQNVRYCNDDPDCAEKAKTYSFFGK